MSDFILDLLMRIGVWLVILLLIYVAQVIFIVMEKRYVSGMTENDFTVMYNKTTLYIGNSIVFFGFFLVVIANTIQEPNIAMSIIVFSIFALLGLPFIFFWMSSRVIVYDTQITAKFLFRRSFSFTFSEICQIVADTNSVSIWTTNGNNFRVNQMQRHYMKFLNKLEKQVPHLCPWLATSAHSDDTPDDISDSIPFEIHEEAAHDKIIKDKVSHGMGSIGVIIMCIIFIVFGSSLSLIALIGYLADPIPEDLDVFVIVLGVGLGFILLFSILLERGLKSRVARKAARQIQKFKIANAAHRSCPTCRAPLESSSATFCTQCGRNVIFPDVKGSLQNAEAQ